MRPSTAALIFEVRSGHDLYEARARLTERFDRALLYATHVHGGQVRKGTSVPHLAHLLAVAATVLEYGGDEDMAIAGLLHDAAEDHGGVRRLDDIRNRFGDRVAAIVRSCSDSLVEVSGAKEEWRARKERHVRHLDDCDGDTLLVSLADKVHNARSILRDLRKSEIGRAVWQRFKCGPEDQLWYYGALAAAYRRLLPGQLAEELAEIVALMGREQVIGSCRAARRRLWHFCDMARHEHGGSFPMERRHASKCSYPIQP